MLPTIDQCYVKTINQNVLLQGDCNMKLLPYGDLLLRLAKPSSLFSCRQLVGLLIRASETNAVSFLVAAGVSPLEHIAYQIPAFMHVCLSFFVRSYPS